MMSDKEYNRYLGLKMLGQLNLYAGFKNTVDVVLLGECIRTHKHVVITCEILDKEKVWVLKDASDIVIKKAWGHGYLIKGKHFQKIGVRKSIQSGPSVDSVNRLKKGEKEKRIANTERDIEKFYKKLDNYSSDNSSNLWIRKEIRKLEKEKEIIEKVEKGILPQAKIIYTPMGNDKRRK